MEQMEKNFERLKEIDKIAYEDLRERGVQHWCMAYFNTFCKVSYNILCNFCLTCLISNTKMV